MSTALIFKYLEPGEALGQVYVVQGPEEEAQWLAETFPERIYFFAILWPEEL